MTQFFLELLQGFFESVAISISISIPITFLQFFEKFSSIFLGMEGFMIISPLAVSLVAAVAGDVNAVLVIVQINAAFVHQVAGFIKILSMGIIRHDVMQVTVVVFDVRDAIISGVDCLIYRGKPAFCPAAGRLFLIPSGCPDYP